jgi:hypothetical protein
MARVDLHNLGKVGVIKDIPGHQLPPEVWSDLRNIRCADGNLHKFLGHMQVLGTPSVNPGFLINVPTPDAAVWLYASADRVFVEDNGSHTEITNTGGFTSTLYEQWDGTLLGGIPILNNEVDPPQMWPSLSSGDELVDLTNWPENTLAKKVRAFGPFLVALNITDLGGAYPHMVWWSHPAEVGDVPVTWDYSDPDFQAGRRELTDIEGGTIQDGMMLRDTFIIYKQFSTHIMRFVGGQNIMKTDQLFAGSGILAPRCVAPIEKGTKHFVATQDDIIVHNGQSIDSAISNKNRKYLQRDLSQAAKAKAFCAHNPAMEEAWFCYPEVGQSAPTKAFVLNYKDGTQYFRDFSGRFAAPGFVQTTVAEQWDNLLNTWDAATDTWGAEGYRQLVVADADAAKFFQIDSTNAFDGADIPFLLEREGLAIFGKDRGGQPKVSFSNRKLVTRIWIKADSPQAFDVQLGAQEFRKGPIEWAPAQSFDPNTEMYKDFTVNGRLIAVRFSGSHQAEFSLEGYDLEIEVIGEL